MDYSELVGKNVISINSGVGRVVGVESLTGDDSQYLVIEYIKDKTKSYMNIEGKKTFREFTSLQDFQESLENLHLNTDSDFESKQERIKYFRKESRVENLDHLIGLIGEMKAIEDLGTVEVQIYDRIIDSIALELSVLSEKPLDNAKTIILEKIEGMAS